MPNTVDTFPLYLFMVFFCSMSFPLKLGNEFTSITRADAIVLGNVSVPQYNAVKSASHSWIYMELRSYF